MISVMQDFEIPRNSSASVTPIAERSFLGMDNPQEGAPITDGGYAGVSSEHGDFPLVISDDNMSDLDARVSENGEKSVSGYVEEKAKLESYFGDEDMVSLVGEHRDSFVESSGWIHGFRVGDMVWGKVKSHPWWPGHIYNEAFASPSVRRMRGDGVVLVAFFGDSSYGWFDPAELIPFEPYFPEKSRQTTSRNFVRAVEEAVDEASRRGALAVACRCRNPQNFRQSLAAGCFYVDVVGYEPGGLYSSLQIKEARDNFVPSDLLSFILQLALGPRRNNDNTIEWIQTIAKLLAYRRSVFEEFDETYAQAFGVEPVRPIYGSVGGLDQTGRFAPRVAPLSGQLVVAEPLGSRRSSTRIASNKPAKVNKNKYLLKRRDDLAVAGNSFFPGLPPVSQPSYHALLRSFPDSGELAVSGELPNYVMEKREKPPSPLHFAIAADSASDDKPKQQEGFLPADYFQKPALVEPKNERGYSQKPAFVESKNEWGSAEYFAHTFHGERSQELDAMDLAMKEVWKRPRDELSETREGNKRRKKKKDGVSAIQHAVFVDAGYHKVVSGGSSIGVGQSSDPYVVPHEDGIVDMELPPGIDLSSLQLPELVNDLSWIALDPFYGVEQDAPAIVRHVFLRFRSLVYQKSLILLGASEPSAPVQTLAIRDGKGQKESSISSYPSKSASKLGGVIKPGGRKREPSDRQGDISMKKIKKMNQLKELAHKKKASMKQNNSEIQQHQQKSKDQKDSASIISAEATKKQELLPSPPKHPSPTFLIMKFPPRSSLPSVSNLKARFARFGPLDPTATRIYWKSYTCKVLFKYKSDAQSACDFAKNNDLFGQVKVHYNLRDLEISLPDQSPDSLLTSSSKSEKDSSLQYLHGSSTIFQRPQNQLQLKSILKKPVADESGPNSAGAIAKESPRVKFMLKVDENRTEPPTMKVVASSSNDGTGHANFFESPDQISSRQTPNKSIGFSSLPPPPPPSSSPPQHPPLQLPPRGLETHPHRIPPSVMQQILPPPPRGVDYHSLERPFPPSIALREKIAVDISGPMLSLLLKCNDVVGKVKSSLGYTPYHAL